MVTSAQDGAQSAQDQDTQATTERQARSDSRDSVTVQRPKHGQVLEHPQEKRDRAFRMFCDDDKAKTDIAFELRIPVGTIYAWAKRDQWDTRKGVESAGVGAETSQSVAKALAKRERTEPSNLDLTEKQERYQALMGDAAIRVAEHVATLEGSEIVPQADKLLKADQIARKALKLETEKPSTVIQIGVLAQSPAKQERKSIEHAAADVLTLDV